MTIPEVLEKLSHADSVSKKQMSAPEVLNEAYHLLEAEFVLAGLAARLRRHGDSANLGDR